jgi:hypothetical protein
VRAYGFRGAFTFYTRKRMGALARVGLWRGLVCVRVCVYVSVSEYGSRSRPSNEGRQGILCVCVG